MEIARVLLLVLVILSLGYTLFAIYQLKVAKSNCLDTKREKGLSDCGTGQSVELDPSVVVLHGSINLRASVGSWVEIDFCHSAGKVPKDSMNEFCAHPLKLCTHLSLQLLPYPRSEEEVDAGSDEMRRKLALFVHQIWNGLMWQDGSSFY